MFHLDLAATAILLSGYDNNDFQQQHPERPSFRKGFRPYHEGLHSRHRSSLSYTGYQKDHLCGERSGGYV